MEKTPILDVRNLKVYFDTVNGLLKAVDDVSFYVWPGETLGIAGESGCGKSVSCSSILRLVPSPPAVYAGGQILFDNQDILKMNKHKLRALRGGRIAMIFQEPMSALNPVYTIKQQIVEAIRNHLPLSRHDAADLALDLLKQVRIPNPENVLKGYPFTLSGGMRQRVAIAMALSCKPDLLIADEPTTALDVTIQAQVLRTMKNLKEETGTAILFITHDLGILAETADRIMIMYAGKVCESGWTRDIIKNPLHPYTQGLINSRPTGQATENKRLKVIEGNVPSLMDKPSGCPFHPRCRHAMPQCSEAFPETKEVETDHYTACWLYSKADNNTKHEDRSYGSLPGEEPEVWDTRPKSEGGDEQ